MDIDMHNGQVGASYSGRDETIGRRSAFSRLSPSHSSHSMPLFFQQAWTGHPLPVSPMYISPALQQRGRGIVESHPSFLKVFVHNHNSSGTSSCHIEWDSIHLEELVRECTFQIQLGVHTLLGHTRLWTQKGLCCNSAN